MCIYNKHIILYFFSNKSILFQDIMSQRRNSSIDDQNREEVPQKTIEMKKRLESKFIYLINKFVLN